MPDLVWLVAAGLVLALVVATVVQLVRHLDDLQRMVLLATSSSRYDERLDDNHPDGQRCPTDAPCDRCGPLLIEQETRDEETAQIMAGLPQPLRALVHLPDLVDAVRSLPGAIADARNKRGPDA